MAQDNADMQQTARTECAVIPALTFGHSGNISCARHSSVYIMKPALLVLMWSCASSRAVQERTDLQDLICERAKDGAEKSFAHAHSSHQ